jgi:hypothetical protein
MKRPEIKDFFHEKTDLETIHAIYTKSPHLFSYANALDRYIDFLEDKLEKNEQIPKLTLDQAIEKAKPNMDKIKDVDAHLNEIK